MANSSPRLRSRDAVCLSLGCLLLTGLAVLYGIGDLGAHADLFVPVYLGIFLVYLAAVALVSRDRKISLPMILGMGIVFRLLLLIGDPTLSDDIYRYVHDGHMQVAGVNPFSVAPEDVPGHDPRINHPEIPTIYPPGMQVLFAAVAWLSPSILAMKVLAMGFDVGLCFLLVSLLKLKRMPKTWVLVYAWNPLVLIEITKNGHNDVVAIFFLLLALRLFLVKKEFGAQIAFGGSVLTKLFTAPVWPFFLKGPITGRRAVIALVCPAIVLAVSVPYAMGGNLFTGLLTYGKHWHFNDSVFAVLRSEYLFGTKEAARIPALALLVVSYIWLLIREKDPIDGCAAVLGLMLVIMPTVHPWYVTWIVPVLVLRPRLSWLLLTGTVVLAYHVRVAYAASGNVVWEEKLWIRLLEYIPFYAVWIGEQLWLRGRRPELAPETFEA